MDNKKNRKNIFLIALILLIGLAVAGGTYAWLSLYANVDDATYSANSTCFLVDYTDQEISGTLFPSSGPNKGLHGSVTLKLNSSCTALGTGTLYLHVNNGTSTKFGETVAAHCENPDTLVTLPDYKTSSDCDNHDGIWVTNGTALKVALYDNDSFTGNPLAVGRFVNSLIGIDVPQYSNIDITYEAKTYYMYVWLDGYISDNTYTNLSFDGYVYAKATQHENETWEYTSNWVSLSDLENTAITLNQPIPNGISTYQTFEDADQNSGLHDMHIKNKVVNNIVVDSYLDFNFNGKVYSFRGGVNESSLAQKPVYESNKAIVRGAMDNYEDYCFEDDDGYGCSSNSGFLSIGKDGTVFLNVNDFLMCGIVQGSYLGIPGGNTYAGCMLMGD